MFILRAFESKDYFDIVRKISVCKIEVHYVGKIGLAFQECFGLVRIYYY